MLNIQPFRNQNLGCGEMVFATFLRWKNIRHELMFEYSWGKEFLHVGDHVTEKTLKKYYNMEVVWKSLEKNRDEIICALEERGNPVALAIDLKEAYWLNSSYTMTLPLHCILVIGEKDNGCYQCLDPTFLDNCIEFVCAGDSNIEFSELKIKEFSLDKEKILSELFYCTKQLHNSVLGKKITDYAVYLSDVLEKERHRSIKLDLYSNIHLYTLNRISRDILNYSSMLKYIQECSNISFEVYIGRFIEIARRWEMIRNMVTKYYYTLNTSMIAEIKKEICIMAEWEIQICERLFEYLQNM